MVTNYALKCRIHLHSPFYVIGFGGGGEAASIREKGPNLEVEGN